MNILAVDTSTDRLSVALMKSGKIEGRFHRKTPMSHSRLLIPMIDRILKRSKLKLKNIDAFAISIGPGSFTGLRIGVTTVKALAYSLDRPIVAIPTLDVIAQNAKSFKGVICPVLDARKNKVYACIYKSNGKNVKKISGYLLLPLGNLIEKLKRYDKILFLGDVMGTMKSWHPKASVVACLGFEYLRAKRFVSPEKLEPMYLYSKECDITGK